MTWRQQQERIMVEPFGTGEGAERFKYSLFLVLCNRLTSMAVAIVSLLVRLHPLTASLTVTGAGACRVAPGESIARAGGALSFGLRHACVLSGRGGIAGGRRNAAAAFAAAAEPTGALGTRALLQRCWRAAWSQHPTDGWGGTGHSRAGVQRGGREGGGEERDHGLPAALHRQRGCCGAGEGRRGWPYGRHAAGPPSSH